MFGQSSTISIARKTEQKINNLLVKSDSCKIKLDYVNSFQYISEVLSLAKKNNDINLEILCHIKQIELYRHASLFEKSEFYLHQTEVLINKNNAKVSDTNLMYFYSRKAAIFAEFYHIPDSTLLYSQKALQLSKGLNDTSIQFTSLMEIGFYYENKNQLTMAIDYYEQSYNIAVRDQSKLEQSNALINIARTLNKKNDYLKAIEKCDVGLELLKNSDYLSEQLRFYDIKYTAYEHLGDKASAFDFLKLRLQYTDLYYEKKAQEKLLEENKKNEILEKDKDIEQVKKNQLLLMAIILLFVLGLISLIYYSKKIKITSKQLDFLSKENAFLLNEANHRINNNLQLIIVLLNEELDKIEDSDFEGSSVKKILTKVESIATLHRHLYQSDDKKTVDIQEYLNEIVANFDDIFTEKEIQVKYNIEQINLPIDLVMYLGLLTTELFINSIKHAFNNQENSIISLKIYKKKQLLHFGYNDNGEKAIGKEIKPNLATSICKQIKANYKIETKAGFEFYVTKDL